ncbi:MAG TPA: hypothetical protein ENJ18_09770 [Nannocystis exedens]|nr:hypothetical protein [Nannocystis exedens]
MLRRSNHVPWGSYGIQKACTLCLAALSLTACNFDYDPPPSSEGELGRGDFLYRCVGDSDALCPAGSQTATVFPQAIALGGAFSLDYSYNSEFAGESLPLLKSSAPDRISIENGIFNALALGYTAINAVSGTSEVIDIKHLRVASIDHLIISESELTIGAMIEVEAGSQISLVAAPYGAQDELLGGSLDYTWTSADPTIAAVVGAGTDNNVAIEGSAEGQTTVTVVVGDLATAITVVVQPGAGSDSDTTTTTTDDSTTGTTDDSTTGTTTGG